MHQKSILLLLLLYSFCYRLSSKFIYKRESFFLFSFSIQRLSTSPTKAPSLLYIFCLHTEMRTTKRLLKCWRLFKFTVFAHNFFVWDSLNGQFDFPFFKSLIKITCKCEYFFFLFTVSFSNLFLEKQKKKRWRINCHTEHVNIVQYMKSFDTTSLMKSNTFKM